MEFVRFLTNTYISIKLEVVHLFFTAPVYLKVNIWAYIYNTNQFINWTKVFLQNRSGSFWDTTIAFLCVLDSVKGA